MEPYMEHNEELSSTMDRLAAAADRIEQLAERLAERHSEDHEATIGRIVAMVDQRRGTAVVGELEQKLAAAEQRIAELEARAITAASEDGCPISRRDVGSRKTVPAAMTNLLAKHGVSLDSVEAGTLDAALTGLSLEQRIAVKAQLLRAGLFS
jgi:BMFP domain-containing protein YqiC